MASLDNDTTAAITALGGFTAPVDFYHRVEMKNAGKLDYHLSQPFEDIGVSGDFNATDSVRIDATDLRSHKQTVVVRPSRDRKVNVGYETKAGANARPTRVEIRGVPAATRRPASINLKPGVGALDLIPGADSGDTTVVVTGGAKGKSVERRFRIRNDGPIRLNLQSAIAQGIAVKSDIAHLFAPGHYSEIIRSQ